MVVFVFIELFVLMVGLFFLFDKVKYVLTLKNYSVLYQALQLEASERCFEKYGVSGFALLTAVKLRFFDLTERELGELNENLTFDEFFERLFLFAKARGDEVVSLIVELDMRIVWLDEIC